MCKLCSQDLFVLNKAGLKLVAEVWDIMWTFGLINLKKKKNKQQTETLSVVWALNVAKSQVILPLVIYNKALQTGD